MCIRDSNPSYVSLESALSFYGLIPERVFSVSSMTFKTSKKFTNEFGNFEYIKIPTPYYSFGIKRISIRDGQFSLMAMAEKALMDKVITTAGIIIRSETVSYTHLDVYKRQVLPLLDDRAPFSKA